MAKPPARKAKPAKPAKPTKPRRSKVATSASRPSKAAPKQAKASAKTPATSNVDVRIKPAAPSAYRVQIGAGLLASGAVLASLDPAPRAVLAVIDAGVPRASIEPLLRQLDRSGVRWGVSVVTATEAAKTLATMERALIEAGRLRLERGDAIFAVGGGIVCDVAGFAAAVYRRGVRIVQCPTTLLAMVDAAVGGKTAANLTVPTDGDDDHKPRLVKNLIGAFHQPAAVIADVATLASLPPREFRSGLAECLKHGLIGAGAGDPGLLGWMEKHLPAIVAMDPGKLAELVTRNVALKARVVAADPLELSRAADGGRMALNLGHTFAHAIETLPGLTWNTPWGAGGQTAGPLKHGEAVGLGLIAAATAAGLLKLAPHSLQAKVRALVVSAGLPDRIQGLPASDRLISRMGDDKKVLGGKLRLILPTGSGRSRVVVGPSRQVVMASLNSIRSV